MGRRDRGSGTVLAMSVAVLVMVVGVLVARVAIAAAEQAAAQHAADAAALAGVRGGRAGANQVAAANRAELVAFTVGDGRAGGVIRVEVTVRRGDRTAVAVAEGDPRFRIRAVAPHEEPWCSTLNRCARWQRRFGDLFLRRSPGDCRWRRDAPRPAAHRSAEHRGRAG